MYTYVSRASVESVRPSSAVLGRSAEVTLTGARFPVLGAVSCRWSGGGRSTDVVGRVRSSTMVTCQSPETGAEGRMTVEVSSDGVEYTRGGMEVWYHTEAELTAVRPSRGPEGGGTEVTLVGAGVMQGGAHSRCRFGMGQDRESVVRWATSSVVTCRAPGSGGLVGNVTVELVGEEGQASGLPASNSSIP